MQILIFISFFDEIPVTKQYSHFVRCLIWGYTVCLCVINEPRCEKTGLRGFRPGPTQTGLYSHRRWIEA